MKELLKLKISLKKFVGKNEALILPILKFLLFFAAMTRINLKLGFMGRLASMPVALIVALAGSFLPINLTLVIMALIVTAHMYALSMEVAIVVLALLLVLFLLYFRFAAQDSYGALLTSMGFVFRLPYVMPVSMGLVGTPSSMVAVAFGTVTYQVLHFISENAETLAEGGSGDSKIGQFKTIIDAFITDKTAIVLAVSFAITVLVVYLIRRLSIKYAWQLAIGVGEVTLLFVTLVVNAALGGNVSVGGLFFGVILSALFNFVLQYFIFDLNYNKIEKVQYEDDEYYYYVKAVPKNEYVKSSSGKKKAASKSAAPQKRMSAPANQTKSQAPVRSQAAPVRSAQPSRQAQATGAYERNMNREADLPSQSQVERTARAVMAQRQPDRVINKGPINQGRPSGK